MIGRHCWGHGRIADTQLRMSSHGGCGRPIVLAVMVCARDDFHILWRNSENRHPSRYHSTCQGAGQSKAHRLRCSHFSPAGSADHHHRPRYRNQYSLDTQPQDFSPLKTPTATRVAHNGHARKAKYEECQNYPSLDSSSPTRSLAQYQTQRNYQLHWSHLVAIIRHRWVSQLASSYVSEARPPDFEFEQVARPALRCPLEMVVRLKVAAGRGRYSLQHPALVERRSGRACHRVNSGSCVFGRPDSLLGVSCPLIGTTF